MIPFKKFVKEQNLFEAKNAHLSHIDQTVLIDGGDGIKTTINFLESLIDMLSGGNSGKLKIGLKWDGSPGLTAGIDPVTKKFFVGTKSVFAKKIPKVNFTNSDVDKFHSGSGDLVGKLKLALKLLPKIWKGEGVFQGDLMFTNDQKSMESVDGESLIVFRPNSIAYGVPIDSDLGKEIKDAKLGIAFHTRYTGNTLPEMSASFDVSKSEFKQHKDVWFDDANLTDVGGALFSKSETKNLNSLLKKLKSISSKVKSSITKIKTKSNSIAKELERYDNNEIKQGFVIKDSKKFFSNFVDWLVKEKKSKLKTFDKTKEKVLRDQLNSEKKDWENVIDFMAQTIVIKDQIVIQLNKVKQLKTFLKTDSGFKVVGQEGFTAISNGQIVKLVDRLEFTKNLFTTAKNWDAS